ncbi:MAG: cache domain-containing protein [Candidatus Nanoarchaeia archaeon]
MLNLLSKYKKLVSDVNWTLLISIFIVLICGSFVTSFIGYHSAKGSLRKEIAQKELPLTGDNVYSEIQRDVLRPVFVSSQMACDTFLRDWVIGGEKDPAQIARYLAEIKEKFGAFTSFFVSEHTFNYYYYGGILKKVSREEPRDVWYFRVREMKTDYEINVDPDLANRDAMTIFINYRVYDYNGNFIGATGVGLTIDSVVQLIEKYQKKYKRTIYFIDSNGNVKLCGTAFPKNIKNVFSLEYGDTIKASLCDSGDKSSTYKKKGEIIHFNTRFIPEFNWYLVVEQEEREFTQKIYIALLINLALCIIVTFIVLSLTLALFKAFNKEIETLRGIIPICCVCKKIRDDKGYWSQLEAYISKRSEASFSHGICPECMKSRYPDFDTKNYSSAEKTNEDQQN